MWGQAHAANKAWIAELNGKLARQPTLDAVLRQLAERRGAGAEEVVAAPADVDGLARAAGRPPDALQG